MVLKVSVFSALPHSPTPCVYLHPMCLSPSHVFLVMPAYFTSEFTPGFFPHQEFAHIVIY